MISLSRRVVQGLGVLGLIFAIVYTLTGGARVQQRAAARAAAQAQATRADVGKADHVRPLDPSVQKARLPNEQKRVVLGLFNSMDGELEEGLAHAEYNHVHLKAELILNHLGLLVELRDVNDPLLDDKQMSRYVGVIAWFRGQKMRDPLAYLDWLARQMKAGRRVVVLDGFAASSDARNRPTPVEALRKAHQAMGLTYTGNFIDDPERIQLVNKDPAVVEFEQKLPRRLDYFEQQRLVDPAGKAYLRLKRTDVIEGESDMVVVTPRGGYVAPTYAMSEQKLARNFVMRWRINPFRFFAEAFGVQTSPRLDFTTINGQRIFYSHIDGDGLPSISEIDRKSLCADYAREHILEPYDLPVTVSFVVAGIEPPPGGRGSARRLEAARKVAALDKIEVASHAFTHPMDWRAREHSVTSYRLPGYKMNAEKEIAYSINYINREIAPPHKATTVMLWTGWCNPAEDQLAITYREGVYNLNGGDPMMDAQFPSYLHLAPPMHKVGKYMQYFTSGPNDYILTEEWLPPFHRWRNLIDTMRNTGLPRRIYPMNVYYHFYIAEKPAAMRAMQDILGWVLEQRPAALWVSEYVDIVRDFATARVARVDPQSDQAWRVLNSGYLRTVRFDTLGRHVDLARSKGVLGYRRDHQLKTLYVHLDESHDHTIVLADEQWREPYLDRASAYLDKVSISRDRAKMTTRGYGRKYLTLNAMAPNARYKVVARETRPRSPGAAKQAISGFANTDATGLLDWQGDINGAAIEVTVERVKP